MRRVMLCVLSRVRPEAEAPKSSGERQPSFSWGVCRVARIAYPVFARGRVLGPRGVLSVVVRVWV